MLTRIGPQTSGKGQPEPHTALPPDLAAVALVDAKTAAAPGDVSLSWWHAEVAALRAPQPVIRAPRMTRWRMSDVAKFWAEFAARAQHDARVVDQAAKASGAAARKRKEAAQ